ncbi:hypothetical protein [Hydrogenovibrio marinus]|nr:hypothetical protein [Hydrogenovibrio marinus]
MSSLTLSILGALGVTSMVIGFAVFLIVVAHKKAKEEKRAEAFNHAS